MSVRPVVEIRGLVELAPAVLLRDGPRDCVTPTHVGPPARPHHADPPLAATRCRPFPFPPAPRRPPRPIGRPLYVLAVSKPGLINRQRMWKLDSLITGALGAAVAQVLIRSMYRMIRK